MCKLFKKKKLHLQFLVGFQSEITAFIENLWIDVILHKGDEEE